MTFRNLGCIAILLLVAALLMGADAFGDDESIALNHIGEDESRTMEEVDEMMRRDPNFVLEVLTKLRSRFNRPMENTKRGIDFGLGRGFSGSQAAKHFMGMAAARYSGGPGKKRKRSGYKGLKY